MRELSDMEVTEVSGGRTAYQAWCDMWIYLLNLMPSDGTTGGIEPIQPGF